MSADNERPAKTRTPAEEAKLVAEIKERFLAELDQWIGIDIPDEGTDDYDTWQSRLEQIEAIEAMVDVLEYAESYAPDMDEFLEEWDL
ncbi:MAG: hypothetical protein ABL997_19835 [Planctomycetota bacterium]